VAYADFDTVTFDDTAASSKTLITLNTTVMPGSVTFNNNTNHYTISGTGNIAGTTGLTLTGSGLVTLLTSNTYTGTTNISSGTLQLGNGISGQDGSITGSTSIVNMGSLIFDNVGNQSYSSVLSGSGTISQNGSGGLTFTAGQNTESGPLIINSGSVTLAPLVSTTPAYSTQNFSSISINTGATLYVATVHTFGYASSFRPAIIINGGTVTNSLGYDNYLGNVTMTAGTINGSGEFRLQNTGASTAAALTTLPSYTTATISVPNLALVSYYGNPVIFNVSKGSVTSGPDLLISSQLDNTGMLVKTGAGTMELTASNTYTGGTTINMGLLVADQGINSLGIPNQDTSGGAVAVPTAYINGGNLIFRNTSASSVFSLLQTGFNGGAWNSTAGITSTAAANDTTHLHAVGMLQPSATTTYEGQALYNTDVAVKYTYYGDANLDGKVDGSDYSIIDNSYEMEKTVGSISGWQNGDFNYDGVVDGSDYTLIDNAFNSQGAQISSEVAAPTAQITGGSAAVPEPTTLGLLGVGAFGMLGRRRRR
jgi:fibronectin-binding autotransporter adhesin